MLSRVLQPRTEAAFTFLRVMAGLMFAVHGVQLLFGVLGYSAVTWASQSGVGGIIELVAGLLIAAGLFTRWAAFLASGTMAVAYLQFHWRFAFDSHFFPQVNQGELAVLYSLLFLYVACRGAGRWSLDSLRARTAAETSAGRERQPA